MNSILKNIYEQPAELKRVLDDLTGPKLGQLRDLARIMALSGEIVLTSMGSALYSLMPMYEVLRERGYRNVTLEETGDLIRHPERMSRGALYVLMSRSGESREVADFAVWCREHGFTTLSITMTPDSTMATNSTYMLHDISSYDDIVCIKAYSTMALTGLLLVEMMDGRPHPSEELVASLNRAFAWMEAHKENILAQLEAVPFLGTPHGFYLISRSYGINYQKTGKDLMTRDEISVMDGGKCILQLRGVRPFFSDKYDLTKHPNFKLTADYDKKYTFDIEKYLKRRMKLKADDVYDVIEI